MTVDAFIDRWTSAGASEHGNEQLFLIELCDLLDALPPDPAGPSDRRTRAQAVRAVMTHAKEPLTVEQGAPHVHRALSEC